MRKRDFGKHQIVTDRGVVLECAFMVPGLTMGDLSAIFETAVNEAGPSDHLAGNPALWPTNRGLKAVIDAINEAYETSGLLK